MAISINEVWSTNVSPLTTPTYDESGECTHPDLYDAGSGNTWNGYRYWLAMTPYPNNDVELENPSILASNDLVTWVVPDGLTNPIDLPDAKHRSDPDLFMDGSTLYCYYRAMNGTDDIMWQKSTDGVTWTGKNVEIAAPHSTLSPAIVKVGSEYQMYTIHYTTEAPARIMQKRTASSIEGPWSSAVTVSTANPGGGNLWHLDIINIGGTLYCLMNVNTTTAAGLYLGISSDSGDSWTFADAPFLAPRSNLTSYWDHAEIYRSSMVPATSGAPGYDLIYAAHDNIAAVYEWHLAKTKLVTYDTTANQSRLYVYIENQTGLTSYERTNLWNILRIPGSTQPDAHNRNHQRNINAEAIVIEALLNTDALNADNLKDQLALVMNESAANIDVATTSESYGGGTSTKHVFSVDAADKMTVIIFGGVAATYDESHAEAFGYLY